MGALFLRPVLNESSILETCLLYVGMYLCMYVPTFVPQYPKITSLCSKYEWVVNGKKHCHIKI